MHITCFDTDKERLSHAPGRDHMANEIWRMLLAGRILVEYDAAWLTIGCLFDGDVCMETEVNPETAKSWLWDFATGGDVLIGPAGDIMFVREPQCWKVRRRRWRDGRHCWAVAAISNNQFSDFVDMLKRFSASSRPSLPATELVGVPSDWPPASVIYW